MDELTQRQRLLEVMPDPVFINSDDRITFCNQALLDLLGMVSPSELLGKSPLTLFHPRYHEIIRRRIELMRRQRVAVPMIEEEVVHLFEGTIPVEVVASSFLSEGTVAIVVVLRDLRGRKELEERFRLLVDAVTDYAIYTLDSNGLIVSWNHGAMRLHGFTVAEALGQHHSILFCAEDVAAGVPQRELAGEPSIDSWRLRKDGSRFWCNSVITQLRDRDGRRRARPPVAFDLLESERGATLWLRRRGS